MRSPCWMLLAAATALAGCSQTQTADTAPPPPAPAAQPAVAAEPPPRKLEQVVVYFGEDQALLGPKGEELADFCARLYREGHPTVMFVAGYADATGSEWANLIISARRAETVKKALVARGIPAEQLVLQARGVSDPTTPGQAEPQDRRVVVTWR